MTDVSMAFMMVYLTVVFQVPIRVMDNISMVITMGYMPVYITVVNLGLNVHY